MSRSSLSRAYKRVKRSRAFPNDRFAIANSMELTMTEKISRRLLAFGLQVLAFACALALISATASGATNPKHFFWAPTQPNTPSPGSLVNDLIYHGGNAGPGAI